MPRDGGDILRARERALAGASSSSRRASSDALRIGVGDDERGMRMGMNEGVAEAGSMGVGWPWAGTVCAW